MAETDARKFLRTLEERGLNISQGPDSDAVLFSEFDKSIDPYCEWLRSGTWDKAVIAWKEGTQPETVTAREGWDPKVGSGLTFHVLQDLEFLRLEENLEVFLNKKTGKEVYIGRTSTPVDSIFISASRVIKEHFVAAGEPALSGGYAQEVAKAAEMLEKVLNEQPDWWNAQWFYGKSQMALGNHEKAYNALYHAYKIEKSVEAIPRELAGVCLVLGKFDESVDIAEAAVALEPSNAELLGNLSVSYVLAGRIEAATKALDYAIRIDPDDAINKTILRILSEIKEGRRDMPKSLADFSRPAIQKKPRFFRLPWKK